MTGPDLPALDALRARFVEAQLRGDQTAAMNVAAEAIGAGVPVLDVQMFVIRAAQEGFGEARRLEFA